MMLYLHRLRPWSGRLAPEQATVLRLVPAAGNGQPKRSGTCFIGPDVAGDRDGAGDLGLQSMQEGLAVHLALDPGRGQPAGLFALDDPDG